MGSCVSEHAKDAHHFVDWASVKHIWPGKPAASTHDPRGHKHPYSATNKRERATTFIQFYIEQICSLIKKRLQITANVTDKGIHSDGFQKLCVTFNKLLVIKNIAVLNLFLFAIRKANGFDGVILIIPG